MCLSHGAEHNERVTLESAQRSRLRRCERHQAVTHFQGSPQFAPLGSWRLSRPGRWVANRHPPEYRPPSGAGTAIVQVALHLARARRRLSRSQLCFPVPPEIWATSRRPGGGPTSSPASGLRRKMYRTSPSPRSFSTRLYFHGDFSQASAPTAVERCR